MPELLDPLAVRRARAATSRVLPAPADAASPVPPAPDDTASRVPPAPDDAAWLALQRELGDSGDFEEAAARLCTRLATLLGAARVVLAWRDRPGAAARPVAASGVGMPDWDGAARQRLAAAADESIDQARALSCPPPSGARGVLRAHETLRRAATAVAVVSTPVARRGEPLGALLAEFDAPPPPHAPATIARAAVLLAPWLSLLAATRPGWLARLAAAAGIGRAGAGAGGSAGSSGAATAPRRRLVAAGLVLALAALALVPIDLSIGAPARVEGEVQRTVAAPVRGYLRAVHARPGDRVRAGQLLAELGDRDLELDRIRLASEVTQHEGAAGAAMARGDRAAMAVSQSRAEEARARLGLIEHQLESIRLRAPIDGVLIQGDLAPTLGAPVDRGQSLLVVAPEDRFRVIVELDERDLRRVRVGQRGQIALSALPWDTLPLQVLRVAPAADVVDGRNVFELEARLDTTIAGLRPGLRGAVKLDGGRGPLLVEWLRRGTDRLAGLLWRWLP